MVRVTAAAERRKRREASLDTKANGAVQFATAVAKTRGKVAGDELARVREAGFSDAQIIEIVSVVAENFLTNIINNVAEIDIDFPVVRATEL